MLQKSHTQTHRQFSDSYLLVGEDRREEGAMPLSQLPHDLLRPGGYLPPTPTALQVLGGHQVPAVDVQDLPDGLVHPTLGEMFLAACRPGTPHVQGRPEEQPTREEGSRRGGWLRIVQPGLGGVPPQLEVRGELEGPPAGLLKQRPADPLLLFPGEGCPPALRQPGL